MTTTDTTVLFRAQRLARQVPIDWQNGTCPFCHHDDRKEPPHGEAHTEGCPWQAMPHIVASLEAYAALTDALAIMTSVWIENLDDVREYMIPVLELLDKAQDIADGTAPATP